ncbi:MAG TPA: hypothetical protein V6D20_20725 [Candidatus Obscuribacterales bacterium]
MAKAGDMKMEVGLDRVSRDTIRSLVTAIDRLSDAVLGGVDPEVLSDDPAHVATLRRLVEDVKANKPNPACIERDGRVIRDVSISRERSQWLSGQARAAGYGTD